MSTDLTTMFPRTYVTSPVIDVWSRHLQKMESYRSPNSPFRAFFSTYPVTCTILGGKNYKNAEERSNEFNQTLDDDLRLKRGTKISEVDLFFFPIVHREHFYLIVFNMKKCWVSIIDNSSALDDEDITVKYSHIPSTLVKLFCAYLSNRNNRAKAIKICESKINRMQMPWRNKIDRGVYLMLHMETYSPCQVLKCHHTRRME